MTAAAGIACRAATTSSLGLLTNSGSITVRVNGKAYARGVMCEDLTNDENGTVDALVRDTCNASVPFSATVNGKTVYGQYNAVTGIETVSGTNEGYIESYASAGDALVLSEKMNGKTFKNYGRIKTNAPGGYGLRTGGVLNLEKDSVLFLTGTKAALQIVMNGKIAAKVYSAACSMSYGCIESLMSTKATLNGNGKEYTAESGKTGTILTPGVYGVDAWPLLDDPVPRETEAGISTGNSLHYRLDVPEKLKNSEKYDYICRMYVMDTATGTQIGDTLTSKNNPLEGDYPFKKEGKYLLHQKIEYQTKEEPVFVVSRQIREVYVTVHYSDLRFHIEDFTIPKGDSASDLRFPTAHYVRNGSGSYSYQLAGPLWLSIDEDTGVITGTRPPYAAEELTGGLFVTDKETGERAVKTFPIGATVPGTIDGTFRIQSVGCSGGIIQQTAAVCTRHGPRCLSDDRPGGELRDRRQERSLPLRELRQRFCGCGGDCAHS